MARVVKYLKIIFHAFSIIVLSYLLIQKPVKPRKVKQIVRFFPDIKHLLIWSDLNGVDDAGQQYFIKNKCKHVNCYFTKNKTLFGDTRYFDAIIFSVQDVSLGPHRIPSVRTENQKYIFAANDSADNYPICSSVYDELFNWTWSYRTDSIICNKFFTFRHTYYHGPENEYKWITNMKPIDRVFKSQLSMKTKAAAIFLDKCESRSKREVFLENLNLELARYNLSVDIYGKCGMKCKRSSMSACFWKLRKIYYFYMAMEDSFSDDFVTDTVVYGYKYSAVPIVYGTANYEKYLPPNSYMDALKLGIKDLASDMNFLIKNKEEYYKYFNWRNHYVIRNEKVLDGCSLCEMLNNPSWLMQKGSYTDFRKWWNPDYYNRCAFYMRIL